MGYFLPFYSPNSPKNENLKKKRKKMPRDIIILQKCTKNHNHMVYCSWDMTSDTCNCYFSFLGYFLPFYPNLPEKWKFQKNEKKQKKTKTLEILSFHLSVPKIMIICYAVPEIWCMTDVIIFHFGLFFALLLSQQLKKWKFKKNAWRYNILHKCTKNHNHMVYCSRDMTSDRCNCYFSFWPIFRPFTP